MLRAEEPASPDQELAARRRSDDRSVAAEVLTADLARFCQSGVSIVIASGDRDGWPVVGRGLACRIDGPGPVRIVLRVSSNSALLDAVRDGGGLAVTFTRPTTHRSIQLKAAAAQIGALAPEDAPAARTQTAAFSADLVACGHPDEFAQAYCIFEPHDLTAVDFVPGQAFVQTPGPGAGSALSP